MTTNSLLELRAGTNRVLTNHAQEVATPENVMRLLFPLAEVGEYGGTVIEFDDAAFDEYDDDKAPGAPYKEIQDGYQGRPFALETKGLSYPVPEEKMVQMAAMGVDVGRRAANRLMGSEALKHEIQCAVLATNPANYAASNKTTLTGAAQFNVAGSTPGVVMRSGRSAVSGQIGRDPNVAVFGRDVVDVLAEHADIRDRFKYVSKDSITADMLAEYFGFERAAICNAIRRNPTTGVKERVFGKHIIMAYTNPAALNTDRLPYRPNGAIDRTEPSYGYTYCYTGHPVMKNRWFDEKTDSWIYKIKFDRTPVLAGVDRVSRLVTSGYGIFNAVA